MTLYIKFLFADFYGKITRLREKGVKAVLGVGGLKDSESDKWNRMAADREHRKEFINSALKVLRRWNFDGLQLAWQYPLCKQVSCGKQSMINIFFC